MSEGTMQRRAQRADRSDQRTRRVSRVLFGAAAVPVMLVAAACSSGSDGGDDGKKASEKAQEISASPSPTVRAAAYRQLPEVCDVLTKKTLEDLVPEGTKGKEGSSDDTTMRANCSWSSLDNNGVDGSQFRWLNVSLLRFESDVTRGAGDELAREHYEKQVQEVQAAEGATNLKPEPLSGTGDQATAVRYDLKKKEGDFKQQTIVARVENVVVTLDYNGAGLAGDETPSAGDLMKDAKKAAKEAIASVTKANASEGGGTDGSTDEPGSEGQGAAPESSRKSPSSTKSPSSSSSSSSSKT
ncbi:DUF3558 family protein [Streptomyces sp. NPDC088789]|uniref:DUF3558 family protein n=1 Tax=Streptomyces sp. NPDC088789 TaxID=3365899 RepID=UPI00381F8296